MPKKKTPPPIMLPLVIDVFHHFPDGAPHTDLTEVLARLTRIETQGAHTMSKADDIKAQQTRQGKALTDISADVKELIEKVTNTDGISGTDAAEIIAKGEEITTALEAAAAVYTSAPVEPPV